MPLTRRRSSGRGPTHSRPVRSFLKQSLQRLPAQGVDHRKGHCQARFDFHRYLLRQKRCSSGFPELRRSPFRVQRPGDRLFRRIPRCVSRMPLPVGYTQSDRPAGSNIQRHIHRNSRGIRRIQTLQTPQNRGGSLHILFAAGSKHIPPGARIIAIRKAGAGEDGPQIFHGLRIRRFTACRGPINRDSGSRVFRALHTALYFQGRDAETR